jgi:hypothetical protein
MNERVSISTVQVNVKSVRRDNPPKVTDSESDNTIIDRINGEITKVWNASEETETPVIDYLNRKAGE